MSDMSVEAIRTLRRTLPIEAGHVWRDEVHESQHSDGSKTIPEVALPLPAYPRARPHGRLMTWVPDQRDASNLSGGWDERNSPAQAKLEPTGTFKQGPGL